MCLFANLLFASFCTCAVVVVVVVLMMILHIYFKSICQWYSNFLSFSYLESGQHFRKSPHYKATEFPLVCKHPRFEQDQHMLYIINNDDDGGGNVHDRKDGMVDNDHDNVV